jgi:hypothetical protein
MQFLYFLSSTNPPRYKIGIGNQLKRRVNQVNQTTKGQQRVLIAFDMPFGARRTETMLHRRYSRWHAPLKHGSGRTEWFKRGLWLIEAISIAALVCIAQWGLIWLQIYFILLIFLHG